MIEVSISNQQTAHEVACPRLEQAVRAVLRGEEVAHAAVSVAVVDDSTIQELNRRFLDHDYATDVLSFVLDADEAGWDGEVIVSADTAAVSAPRFGWSVEEELILYVVHGVLHLVGYDDQNEPDRQRMRRREQFHLRALGIDPAYDEAEAAPFARRSTTEGDAP